MARKKRVVYSVHPGVAYMQSMVDNLPKKTGKTIEQWVRFVKRSGPAGEGEQRAWLKEEHGLGGTTAALVTERVHGTGAWGDGPESYLETAAEFVAAMYSGPKAALRPIHDALLELSVALGDDIRICPCKTIVPVYREHVVAEVKPSTRTRIDFGLALEGATGRLRKRLVDTGGRKKGNRITHRFPISSVEEIDDEVARWLRVAYELDA